MIERHAVRAVLLNPAEEILLIKITEPKSKRAFWLTPGGGIDNGEAPTTTLRRELFEETGLTDFEIGPLVWKRQHTFSWDGYLILQREQYYLVWVERFIPTDQHLPEKIERDVFGGFRWWQAAEIKQSQELFAPRRLGALLQSLIKNGPPTPPVSLGA